MLRQSRFLRLKPAWNYLILTRKLRNRVSQQAFRRRQSEYVKQLERKAKAYKPDNERIIELEKENTLLRESLTQCHTKLESLRTTICTLSDGIARTLDDPVRCLLALSRMINVILIEFPGRICQNVHKLQ
jgi:predicted nuclease with TOPRIM domain